MTCRDYVWIVRLAIIQGILRFLGWIGEDMPRSIQKRFARIQLWLFDQKVDIWWDIFERHQTLQAWQVVYDLDGVRDRLLQWYNEI